MNGFVMILKNATDNTQIKIPESGFFKLSGN